MYAVGLLSCIVPTLEHVVYVIYGNALHVKVYVVRMRMRMSGYYGRLGVSSMMSHIF